MTKLGFDQPFYTLPLDHRCCRIGLCWEIPKESRQA